MNALDFLKENRFQNPEYAGYDVCYDDAKEAVKMAIKEERKRVIDVFKTVVFPMCEYHEQENRVINNFVKQLKTK